MVDTNKADEAGRPAKEKSGPEESTKADVASDQAKEPGPSAHADGKAGGLAQSASRAGEKVDAPVNAADTGSKSSKRGKRTKADSRADAPGKAGKTGAKLDQVNKAAAARGKVTPPPDTSETDRAAKAKAYVNAIKTEQDTSGESVHDSASAVTAQKSAGAGGLVWFTLLCALALSAAAGYGVYYLWQQLQTQTQGQPRQSELASVTELQQVQTATDRVRDEFEGLRAELSAQSTRNAEAAQATQDSVALLEKTAARQQQQLRELTQADRDQWLLAETEYLLRLANQRILVSKETSGAMAMLQSADNILQEIDAVSLRPVRRAIADDLAALRGATVLDVDGEYVKLAALANQVDQLRLHDIPVYTGAEEDPQTEATMPAQPAWSDTLAQAAGSITETLGKAFVVRHHDKPVEAMLPPQQELYLRQNLRLMLEQAQLALISRKPATFQESLDKAQQWIARYFNTEDATAQAALDTLAAARGVEIDPPLPDISGSLQALQQFVQNQETSLQATPNAERSKLQPAAPEEQTNPSGQENESRLQESPEAAELIDRPADSAVKEAAQVPQDEARQPETQSKPELQKKSRLPRGESDPEDPGQASDDAADQGT